MCVDDFVDEDTDNNVLIIMFRIRGSPQQVIYLALPKGGSKHRNENALQNLHGVFKRTLKRLLSKRHQNELYLQQLM